MLALPQLGLHYSVETDASDHGLGDALFQTHKTEEGEEGKPLGYWLRTLTAPERNYSATEPECLGVVWEVQKLRPHLLYEKFTVYTDHHSLRWLMTVTDPSLRMTRWRLRLADFDFTISYKTEHISTTRMRYHVY